MAIKFQYNKTSLQQLEKQLKVRVRTLDVYKRQTALEDSKLSYTVADFKTELYPALSEDDKKLIDLFYLKFDNANVLKDVYKRQREG